MDGRKHLRKRSPLLLLVLMFLLYLGFSFWGFELALLVKMTLNFQLSCPPPPLLSHMLSLCVSIDQTHDFMQA